MNVRTESKTGPEVPSLPDVLQRLQNRLQAEQQQWATRLKKDPSRFGEVEVEVHRTLQQAADEVVAGLLAQLGRQPDWSAQVKKK